MDWYLEKIPKTAELDGQMGMDALMNVTEVVD